MPRPASKPLSRPDGIGPCRQPKVRAGLAIGLLALVACGPPSGSGTATESPTAEPSEASALAFCDPLARPDLRTANGDPVVLSGFWAYAQSPYPTDIVTIALRQAGDCVWIVETLSFPDNPGAVLYEREFHGRLDPSFRIIGEFSEVFGSFPGDPWTYGPFVYRVEVSADRVKLVEDRDASDPAPGCGGLPGTCPDPLEYLYVGPFPTF